MSSPSSWYNRPDYVRWGVQTMSSSLWSAPHYPFSSLLDSIFISRSCSSGVKLTAWHCEKTYLFRNVTQGFGTGLRRIWELVNIDGEIISHIHKCSSRSHDDTGAELVWSQVGEEFSTSVWDRCQSRIKMNLGNHWFVAIFQSREPSKVGRFYVLSRSHLPAGVWLALTLKGCCAQNYIFICACS